MVDDKIHILRAMTMNSSKYEGRVTCQTSRKTIDRQFVWRYLIFDDQYTFISIIYL